MKIGEIKNGKIHKEYYGQGYIYKDIDAFENKSNETCYVPELTDTQYNYNDFLRIAKGNHNVATALFEECDWQHPETLMDEWEDSFEE